MPHEDEIAALSATPIVLRCLITDDSGHPSGGEGWTPREIVAHLRDCEEFRLQRCCAMRDQQNPYIQAFDQERLAIERDYRSTNLWDALNAFAGFREQVVQLLSQLDGAGWQRSGLHEEDGPVTIESHIRHAVSHDLVHLRQISESLTQPLR